MRDAKIRVVCNCGSRFSCFVFILFFHWFCCFLSCYYCNSSVNGFFFFYYQSTARQGFFVPHLPPPALFTLPLLNHPPFTLLSIKPVRETNSHQDLHMVSPSAHHEHFLSFIANCIVPYSGLCFSVFFVNHIVLTRILISIIPYCVVTFNVRLIMVILIFFVIVGLQKYVTITVQI